MAIRFFHTLLLSVFLASTVTAADTIPHSPLASGKWVKISADTSGIYQISAEELKSWGFESADKISVYGCGAVAASSHTDIQSDGFCRAASTVTGDGRLLFYAEGPVRTGINPANSSAISYTRSAYDTKSFYFITDSKSPAEIPVRKFSPSAESINWHYAIELIENEVQNYGKGGIFFHDRPLAAGQHTDFTYSVRDFYSAPDAPLCIFKLEAAAKTPNSLNIPIASPEIIERLSSSTNLHIPSSSASNRLYMPSSNGMVNFRPGNFDGNLLTFSIDIPSTFSGSYFAVDKAWLKYPQKLIFDGENDFFINLNASDAPRNIRIRGLSATDKIWDITDPAAVTQLELTVDGSDALASPASETPRRLVVFSTTAQHPGVSYIGEVPNQSLHSLPTPELLIVCTDACRESAEELALIHRSLQAMDVAVVSQEEVFNEFSSGAHHPGAVRRFAKMLYDRTPGKLRYLLLYGAADYSRCTQRTDDFLVCFETESYDQARDATTNYCCDQYFGMLGDDFSISSIHTKGNMLIAVGRIPVLDISRAKAVNEKIRKRLSAPITSRKYLQSLFLSDAGNDHAHIAQSSKVAKILCEMNPAATAIRADSELFPLSNSSNTAKECKTLMNRALQNGVGYFTYCGHGDASALSTKLFDINSATSAEYGEYPFAMLATCGTFLLDRTTNSITDHMIFNQAGGMIGAISSCRSVYLDLNGVLNNSVMEAYAGASSNTCTGDVLKDARSIMLRNNNGSLPVELGLNLMCYNFCGDPAIPLGAPDFGLTITALNGTDTSTGPLRTTALANATLRAVITTQSGEVLSSFNGTALIDIYDTPRVLENLNGGSDRVIADDDIAATFSAPVKNGIIETSFAVPSPRDNEGLHRIIITATDPASGHQAAGLLSGITIDSQNDDYSADVDTTAPVIEEFYLNDSNFRTNGITEPVFTVIAVVRDSGTGIATDNTGIGNVSQLRIDDKPILNAMAALQPANDGRYTLEYMAGPLSEGRHSVTLKAVSNSGESNSATLDFIVDSMMKGTLTADATDPVREPVTLSIVTQHTEMTRSRITIEAADGSVVYVHEGTPSFIWNLTDRDGNSVPDGLYRVRAIFTAGTNHGYASPLELIVVK